jgi:hypothetical protein
MRKELLLVERQKIHSWSAVHGPSRLSPLYNDNHSGQNERCKLTCSCLGWLNWLVIAPKVGL